MTDDGDTTIVQRIINELKHDDIQVRCAAMGKLTVVSAALGPERTRNELLPFLQSCEDDEDEVLEILATQIGSLMEFIGGNEHLPCLVQATEPLLGAEQSKVREKAVDTCKRIAAAMSPEQVQEQFYLLLVRLHSAEWYSPQISLSALICTVYPHMPSDKKEELRKFYHELSTSSISLVRRGASANLGAFTKELEDEYVRPYVLPLLNTHVQDDQDHVRFMSVLTCVDLCSKLSDNESIEHVLPHAKKLATDNAWRVRYMAANHFCDLSKGFGETLVRSEMVDIFVELLQDREGEVRSAAASQITEFCQLLTEDIIISKILKPVSALANDTDEHVRASLAGHVMGLAPLLGKTKTLEHLLNLFLKLLRDEFYEVRLSVISKLNGVNQVIGIELLSDSLLPAITQLAEEKQWRVRLAIINFIPLLAKQLGVEFFDDKLAPLCLNWLVDPVFSIREAACKNIKDLIDVFGVEWGKESIIPKVFAFCDNSNYLYRSTNLLCVNTLTPVVGSDFIDSTLLPQVLRMVSDNVPNIRLKVAKTLKLFVKHTDATVVQERIRPVLDTLLNDNDKDVRFYAQEAVNAISCSA